MNSEDGQVITLFVLLQFSCFTKYNRQKINKQNVNIADETLTDYSFPVGIPLQDQRIV